LKFATEAGKTYATVPLCYRLFKHAGFHRILFLVDRNDLPTRRSRSSRTTAVTSTAAGARRSAEPAAPTSPGRLHRLLRLRKRSRRVESERFKAFTYDELVAQDEANPA
jgi:hypothetical protein